MIYRFIREHAVEFRVETMCRILKVSRSGYHRWLYRRLSKRKQDDAIIKEQILRIYRESRKTYGSPRIHRQLAIQGYPCGKKRVERLMREAGLQAIHKRRYKVTTDSAHSLPVAGNLLNRNFSASRPNLTWVADITYISTGEGWLYLATVMDLYSRKIVGWSMKDRLTQGLVIEALDMAIKQRRPGRGLVIHSDRGSQYAAYDYQRYLWKRGIICSMSRKGDCWDNAVMESFFHTIKTELINRRRYISRASACRDVFEYIEAFYNRQRLHSSIGYNSPENYERQRRVA